MSIRKAHLVGIKEDETQLDIEELDFLSELEEEWKIEWRGMPEFSQEDLTPWKSIMVHFEGLSDLREFSELIGQKLTPKTRSVWFPEAEIGRYANKRYINES